MKFLKSCVLFYIGGTAYMIREFLWRRRSHGSMFLLGGACFLLVGGKIARLQKLPLALRAVLGAGTITALELATGLTVNRDFRIWDYRMLPYQFMGQICLPFSLLWIPVSLIAMMLYAFTNKHLDGRI